MLACVWIVVGVTAGDDPVLAHRLRVTQAVMFALATASSAGVLLSRTLEMNGYVWGSVLPDLAVVLKVTHFGHVWAWRLPALAALWVAFAWQRPRRNAWTLWLAALALAVIVMTRSDTGHMADHGDLRPMVWVDWLHMLAAGVWVGSIFGMSLAVFPRWRHDREVKTPSSLLHIFQRMSVASGVALGVLIVCGVLNTLRLLGGFSEFWHSAFGISLGIKLLLVLAMIGIGARNRYVKLPRLAQAVGVRPLHTWLGRWWPHRRGVSLPSVLGAWRECARAVAAEAILGVVVIATTGVLLHQMPPADMTARMDMSGTSTASMGSMHMSP